MLSSSDLKDSDAIKKLCRCQSARMEDAVSARTVTKTTKQLAADVMITVAATGVGQALEVPKWLAESVALGEHLGKQS